MTESTKKKVRQTAEMVINRVLVESGRAPRQIRDDDILTSTLGLDSLDLATAVVHLERELGVDPFREGADEVQTYGELVSLYELTIDAT